MFRSTRIIIGIAGLGPARRALPDQTEQSTEDLTALPCIGWRHLVESIVATILERRAHTAVPRGSTVLRWCVDDWSPDMSLTAGLMRGRSTMQGPDSESRSDM